MRIVASTECLAPDGLPIVEVTVADDGSVLTASGTCVTYEGTVVLALRRRGVTVRTAHAQATVGAPARGKWEATIRRSSDCDELVVGAPKMDETPPHVFETQRVAVPLPAVEGDTQPNPLR